MRDGFESNSLAAMNVLTLVVIFGLMASAFFIDSIILWVVR